MSNSLRRALAQDDTIIFIGSGISRWSGLPSWANLINELAEYLEENGIDPFLVRQEATVGDLLQAASYGFLKLTSPQIASFIRSTSRTGKVVPTTVHKAIMSLEPSCFITTNYDDLIEQAFREYRTDPSEPNIVLNNQLLEQAEIIHAQARHFIFKPHGDARHAESIVLTREQYRMLMPEGPFSATLNTLKTLLQSRPVLFLGFGLRDPDFLYLRDLLANIYRGGMRDHYAIIADPSGDQKEYWRRHYGIHLIGYATSDNGGDHSGLLTLLEQLSPKSTPDAVPSALDIGNPASILALARYAAGCLTPSASKRFVIRVNSVGAVHGVDGRSSSCDFWPVERLLREGPERFILLGEPGAGKSFAIQEAVNALASELQDACLRGELHNRMKIPVALDLKLYNGDFESLVDSKFPQGLSLNELISAFPVSLYVDSYNEMPQVYREDGIFDRQLAAFLEARPNLGLVIGSRTSDGLHQFGCPVYRLEAISALEVERHLDANGIELPGNYRHEIIDILQRPFYFRLMTRTELSLDQVRSPGDLYMQFISSVAMRFSAAFGSQIDLRSVLQRHAYATLEGGSEAFAVGDLEALIADVEPQLSKIQIEEIANWLASNEVIIPMRGQRAAFVHQSVTEFLAACQLKTQLEHGSSEAHMLINVRRWDNAIFLVFGMLDKGPAAALLSEIVARDITFALNSARFVQYGSEALVGELLEVLTKLPDAVFDHEAQYAFGRLPFTPFHEQTLRHLLSKPVLRGETFKALASALGPSVKQELIGYLFEEGASWTTMEIGDALSRIIDSSDLRSLVERLAGADSRSLCDDRGVTHRQVEGVGNAISNISPQDIRRETLARLEAFDSGGQRIIAALICSYSHAKSVHGRGAGTDSVEALALLLEVVRARLPDTLFALYLMVRYDPNISRAFLEVLGDALFDTIIYYVDKGDRWSIELLDSCSADESVCGRLEAEAKRSAGIRRLIFDYCASGEPSALFTVLEGCYTQADMVKEWALLQLIDFSELDWSGRHDLFIATLSRRDVELAELILGGSIPVDITGLDSIDMGDVEPWVKWIVELKTEEEGSEGQHGYWVASQIAYLIAQSKSLDNKSQLLQIMSEGKFDEKIAVATMILPNMKGLVIDEFSPKSIDFLKELILTGVGNIGMNLHVFSLIADEEFLREEVLPLATRSEKAGEVVAAIVREAGKRLGIRLALPSGIVRAEPLH